MRKIIIKIYGGCYNASFEGSRIKESGDSEEVAIGKLIKYHPRAAKIIVDRRKC